MLLNYYLMIYQNPKGEKNNNKKRNRQKNKRNISKKEKTFRKN